jgi:hypothetical protein
MKIRMEYDSLEEMFAGAASLSAQPNNPQVTKLLALAQQLADSAAKLTASSAKLKASLPV